MAQLRNGSMAQLEFDNLTIAGVRTKHSLQAKTSF